MTSSDRRKGSDHAARLPAAAGVWAAGLFQRLESRVLLSAAFDVTGLTALREDTNFSDVDGSNVAVAILDTGIYANNPDLSGNVVAYYNAVTSAVPSTLAGAGLANAVDKVGHGSHVAGTAASTNPDIGVATAADIVSIKVLADSGERELAGDPILRGLQFVAQYADALNIKVVNMSLGEANQNGGINYNFEPAADDIARAIGELEDLGITVVSASGNSYANDPDPGASYPAVVSTISVAATWSDNGPGHEFSSVAAGSGYDNYAAFERSAAADRLGAFSQRSTLENQLAAPGVDIYSTWNNSSADVGSDLLHNTISGTSMASPFVAGVVALMQDAAFTYGGRYIEDVDDVVTILRETADQITDANVADNGRYAIVNGSLSGGALNLPETGLTYSRVNVQRAIQRVREIYTGGGGATPGGDTNATTATATVLPSLNGTRQFSRTGDVGTDGFVAVGADDVDLFKLDLSSPGALTIALSNPDDGLAFEAVLRIFDSTGAQIYRADATGGVYPSLVTDENNPLPIGTYYVGISSLSNVNYAVADGSGVIDGSTAGDYKLTVSLSNPDPNGVAQGSTVVDLTLPDVRLNNTTVANLFNGTIGSDPPLSGSSTRVDINDGDVDMFKVVAPDTGELTVQTQALGIYANAADTYVRVFDSNFAEVAFNDDRAFNNTDSLVTVNTQIGQTYYVAVTNFTNRTFNVLDPYGRVANSSPTDQSYDLYLSFNNGDTNGTVFLSANPAIGATYTDSIGKDNDQAIDGANGGFKDVDFVAYTAGNTAGLLDVVATPTTNGFEPAITVWELDAEQQTIVKVADAAGAGARLVVELAARRTVYVSVTGRGNQNFNWFAKASGTGGQVGAYTLQSKLRPFGDFFSLSDGAIVNGTPGTITANDPVRGDIGTDGPLVIEGADIDLYKFVAPATGTFDVRTETSQEGSADTVLRIFDAGGNELAANDNASDRTAASAVRLELVAGQTYYVGVNGAGTGTASYNPNTGTGTVEGSRGGYSLTVSTSGASAASVDGNAMNEPTSAQASLQFTVELDFAADAPITLNYATADGTAMAGLDYIAASGSITFAPGETTKTISVQVLADTVEEGDETFSVNLSAQGDNVLVADPFATGTIFGADEGTATLPFGGSQRATFTGSDGRPVTISIKGPGSGSVTVLAAGVATISASGTTGASSLVITGEASLQELAVNGSLKALTGKTTDLAGDVDVTGIVGKVAVRNASGGTLTIDGFGGSVTLSLVNATDFAVDSASPIKSIKANQWLDTDATPDEISAPTVAALVVKGGFSADLITADIGKFTAGSLTNSDVRSTGNIGTVKVGSMIGSRVYAGVREDVDELPDSLADFSAPATLKSVTVTGKNANAFSDSRIAAPTIAKASLGTIATTANGGAAFGVAADVIASATAVAGDQRIKVKGAGTPGESKDVGDFELRVL